MTQLELDFGCAPAYDYYVSNLLVNNKLEQEYTLRFYNQDSSQPVAALDWTQGTMKYTGDFEQGAKVLFNWLCDSFKQRLDQEYTKGFNDGIRK